MRDFLIFWIKNHENEEVLNSLRACLSPHRVILELTESCLTNVFQFLTTQQKFEWIGLEGICTKYVGL